MVLFLANLRFGAVCILIILAMYGLVRLSNNSPLYLQADPSYYDKAVQAARTEMPLTGSERRSDPHLRRSCP